MKNILSISILALVLQGCLAGPTSRMSPLGPSVMVPAPGGSSSTTLYSSSFGSTADLTAWADHPGTQCCGTAVNPYLNSTGALPYKTGPYSAYFPVYSATVDRYYDMALSTWNGDVEATYYVLGAPREVVIGYYAAAREVSAFKFYWVGSNFNVQVVNGSTWSTVYTYNSGNINAWHEYRFYYHAATRLTDYYIDGMAVASGVDSYTNGPTRYTSFNGFTIATKLGYDDVQIDDITVVGH